MKDFSIIPAAADPVSTGQRIPKRIIQFWCTGRKSSQAKPGLPLSCQASATSIKLLHPEFEYCFFDDERMDEFVAREFPEYLKPFAAFPYSIQRYDFFRCLALYRLGGFYLDMDVYLARSLAPLLEFECVLPFEELTLSAALRSEHGLDWEVGNYAFGAAPGHPFLKAVIDNCVDAQRDPGRALRMIENIPACFRSRFEVFWTTGPGLVTRTLAENRNLHPTVAILFPKDVCDERNWHSFGDYGVHLMQNSWIKRDGFLRTKMARLWENWQRSRQLLQSKQLGPLRPGEWTAIPCSQENQPAHAP